MRTLLLFSILALAACNDSRPAVRTPADTQPRPYINDITAPQPQINRTGSVLQH